MKAISKNKGHLVLNIIQEKCPNCGEAHVFEKNTKIFEIPIMKERCEVCNYKFDREPGYFLGAMYISYGIAVFFCILLFVLCYSVFPELPTKWFLILMTLGLLMISKKNYKLSRIIFIHIFPW